jgi:hypothetical protein
MQSWPSKILLLNFIKPLQSWADILIPKIPSMSPGTFLIGKRDGIGIRQIPEFDVHVVKFITPPPRCSSLDRALEQRRDDLALEQHEDEEGG